MREAFASLDWNQVQNPLNQYCKVKLQTIASDYKELREPHLRAGKGLVLILN